MPPSANSGPSKVWWIAAVALLLACAVFFPRGKETQPVEKAPTAWRPPYQEHVRKIGAALAEFHTVRGTDTEPYPYDLRQLESMGFVDDIRTLLAVKRRHAGDWQYFSAADGENPKAPLLVSPPLRDAPISPAYLLLTTDGRISVVDDRELEESFRVSPLPPVKVPAPVEDRVE